MSTDFEERFASSHLIYFIESPVLKFFQSRKPFTSRLALPAYLLQEFVHVNLKIGQEKRTVYLITTFTLAKATGRPSPTRFPEEPSNNAARDGNN
jgi:hypothetical protein